MDSSCLCSRQLFGTSRVLFGDNQILQMYGFEHKSLASSRVKRTRNETSVPLEVKDDPGFLHPSFKAVKVLNQIVYELPAEHPLADSRPLRELLGVRMWTTGKSLAGRVSTGCGSLSSSARWDLNDIEAKDST